MKISTQAIKFINQHYGSAADPAPSGVDDLVQKIGAQLGAVEAVADFGQRFEQVVIVKVVSCDAHSDADRLHVCKVDDGGKVQNVERDDAGHVQIVCGASNVQAGMLAAWLPPGSTVPSTVDKDPFVLEVRDMRGQKSHGMLASPKELGLSDYHEGILEIVEDQGSIPPGTTFADQYHLRGDVIIDMENKMFTHRPDCFGYLGIAREIEGISQRPYKSPQWYRLNPDFPAVEVEELRLEVVNELPRLVPRFSAIAMRGVKVGPSPVWLQVDLARAGLRSINNIVDYTNFFMLETGQPLHAYDYDKVLALQAPSHESRVTSHEGKVTMVVRHPKPGEKIKLLNGKEIEPRAEAVMIATDNALLGVGGVMGGADTEVDENTTNIILEAANFDLYSVRRTSMAHGLFTDAVTRFNKGQSPLQTLPALAKIVDEISRYDDGKVASPLIDDNHLSKEMLERGSVHLPVTVSAKFINERLGLQLSAEEVKTLLTNVEFEVDLRFIPLDSGAQLYITAPFWRTDIEIPEDVVEEVGRLYGYDHLPLVLPQRSLSPAPKEQMLELKNELRQVLAAAGANEVLTYSFVHGSLLDKAGQSRGQAFQIANALSPDLQYYRLSLTPSLLEKVHPNIKAGQGEFVLFELGKTHNNTQLDYEGLPKEAGALSLVFAAADRKGQELAGAPYFKAKKYLSYLLEHFGTRIDVRFEPLEGADLYHNPRTEQQVAPYEPSRSAVLRDKDNLVWGVVGEFRQSVCQNLKLPLAAAGFEVDPLLFLHPKSKSAYTPLSKFPRVEQDICLKVPVQLPYARLVQFVEDHLAQNRPDQTYHTLSALDIYQRADDKTHKQVTLRLSLASYERTLTDEEVNKLLDDVARAARDNLNAERV